MLTSQCQSDSPTTTVDTSSALSSLNSSPSTSNPYSNIDKVKTNEYASNNKKWLTKTKNFFKFN